MASYTHFTDEELIANLSLSNDLTPLEHELLDRLIRAQDAIKDLEDEGAENGADPRR